MLILAPLGENVTLKLIAKLTATHGVHTEYKVSGRPLFGKKMVRFYAQTIDGIKRVPHGHLTMRVYAWILLPAMKFLK